MTRPPDAAPPPDTGVEPTPGLRREAERLATVSSCCGFVGEVTLTDSAVVMLYAGMLGAGDMLAMLTTSVLPLLNGLCLVPMAALVAARGPRPVILRACALAGAAYFVAVAAPLFGAWRVVALIGAVLAFAFSLTGFIAGWFPLLDTFLTADGRTRFFGRMRFSHQLAATAWLVAAAFVIGREPTLGLLQGILFAAGIVFAGRGLAIARMPRFAVPHRDAPGFRAGLRRAVGNKALTGFSLYLFALNLAAFGTVPLMMLMLKNRLGAPDNVVVLCSAASLSGMLLGYRATPRLARWLGPRLLLPAWHVLFIAVNTALFFCGAGSAAVYAVVAALLLVYSGGIASVSIVGSAEMMALAAPGNKVMAMAVSGAFSYGGAGLSRLVSSLLLGSGILAGEWSLGGLAVGQYQSLLLVYAAALTLTTAFLLLVPAVFPWGEYRYEAPPPRPEPPS